MTVSQLSKASSRDSMSSPPSSPTSSLHSCPSSCSDVSDGAYRELQFENHSLRKRLRQDHQRFAIVLEQYREDERNVQRMQQKVAELQSHLDEANAQLIDALEANHELKRSMTQLRQASTRSHTRVSGHAQSSLERPRRAATEPVRRETFYEESAEQDDNAEEVPLLLADNVEGEETPKAKAPSSHVQNRRGRQSSDTPLSPLSLRAAPAQRRDAISATQDSYLARSLHSMSEQITSSSSRQRKSKSHSRLAKSRAQASAITPHSSCSEFASTRDDSELVPVVLSSAKRLPKPRSGWELTPWSTGAMAVSAAG